MRPWHVFSLIGGGHEGDTPDVASHRLKRTMRGALAATAVAGVRCDPATFDLISRGDAPKGDVLGIYSPNVPEYVVAPQWP